MKNASPRKAEWEKKKLWIFKREHDRIIYGWQLQKDSLHNVEQYGKE